MACYKIEDLTFTYPSGDVPAIDGISLTVNEGEFITICGKSGCGKSTLLRHLKPPLAPNGVKSGKVWFDGKSIDELDFREQSEKIGFVLQNPDNQLVTDKVWHELAFGLESLGVKTPEIRARVAEMASFFGIETWFHKDVADLSGGQKQLLNLASVMAMQPAVLILDEPTSQLDPIAARDFLDNVSKINRELGITVILTEHRLEEAFALSDRVVVMESGRVIADEEPHKIAGILRNMGSDMLEAMPTASRVATGIGAGGGGKCPVTVREGRIWLDEFTKKNEFLPILCKPDEAERAGTPLIELKSVYFRYEKDEPDALCGLSAKIYGGEIYAILGGNGAGKTTALSVISAISAPQRGSVLINGRKPSEISNLYGGVIGVMPQNPQVLFVKKTVREDLYEMLSDKHINKKEQDTAVSEAAELCELDGLLDRHPYDLSGGEQQRAALAKILLLRPKILLLDEPTKGLDAHFKRKLADILVAMKNGGAAVVIVSHDIEFCAEFADRCAMLFNGEIVSEGGPREFFADKSFYTTAANRMARQILPDAVLADDIISACGGNPPLRERIMHKYKPEEMREKTMENRITKPKIVIGVIFALIFIASAILCRRTEGNINLVMQLMTLVFAGMSLYCFIPKRLIGTAQTAVLSEKRRFDSRTAAAAVAAFVAIPLTMYLGTYYPGERKYYFISLLIILETLIPFAFAFERRKNSARELVITSVLCAIAVAGRAAFFMLPQFKPMAAVIIIAGAAMGAQTGFAVGAVSGFVSNFFFGQGPLTPWQMYAFALIGFFAGLIFRRVKTRGGMCVYGFVSILVIYGGLLNPVSIILWQPNPTPEMILSGYIMGLPFDLLHAAATVFFLYFAAGPMTGKIDRIKMKYGLM